MNTPCPYCGGLHAQFHKPPCDESKKDLDRVLGDVGVERLRQDVKWGGAAHDDEHSVHDFVRWIGRYAEWASMMAEMNSTDKCRKRLIQVAALAVAAVQMIERKTCGTCDGSGVVDSGGVSPWGEGIDIPCPECQHKRLNG